MTLTVFRETFGDGPAIRVIDFFLDNQEFDYSMADVRRNEGLAYNTIRHVWGELIRGEVIKKTRRAGKADMYKLNKQSLVVKQLLGLNDALCMRAIKHGRKLVGTV